MLKLLQIAIEVNSGSVGRIAEQIGEVAISHGWESYIAYARNHLPSQSHIIRIGSIWDIYWHGFMTRIFDNHALCSQRATRDLIRKIEIIKPDIIQLHHIHGYFLNMELLFDYLSKMDIPVVWIFHDCWSITGHCAYFDYVHCEKWETGCYGCVQKKSYPASFIFDRSKRNYILKKRLFNSVKDLTIVPVSYWLGNIVKKSFLKGHRIRVIPNGIDINVFAPQDNYDAIKQKYNIGQKTVLLGVASIWESRKGLNDFIRLQTMIDSNTVIVLVGLNHKQIKRLPKGVIGISRTENVQQLAELYSVADVFINPTWEDTFPTTNLEALACGTPIITYRTGGSVEAVSPETGFIVEQGNVNAIWQTVKLIREKGKDLYREACRKRAVKLFNKKDKFEEYMQLYMELLKSKK